MPSQMKKSIIKAICSVFTSIMLVVIAADYDVYDAERGGSREAPLAVIQSRADEKRSFLLLISFFYSSPSSSPRTSRPEIIRPMATARHISNIIM